ncbi:hypothetical protein [Rhizobium sp. S163]|uniref:hypothetical protein n=1 Tax=Rhizobium sp. S163 TaxID=3055039 RepID=UPI0025A9E4C6|nr:hypothetical protein [Rhizobium sp. S163]MDM9645558.1 hypothetical protein [Rhizobium sp. S163]
MSNSQPTVSKNAIFPFQVSVACWIDLLGYGSMIAEAGFSPLRPKAAQALKRLRRFHEIVASHSVRHFPTLVMNDGAVAYRDLSLRSRSNTHDFLNRAWKLFVDIRQSELRDGYPGARLVLASGYRMRGRRAGMDASAGHFESLMKRYNQGNITADRAIREAASIRPAFDIVPQLQANFAFTKAYVAESAGSAGGLPGANFYVDMALFQGRPTWLHLGPEIEWSHPRLGLKATFSSLIDIPILLNPEAGPLDIRDGLQVAQHVEGNADVLASLRAAKNSRN